MYDIVASFDMVDVGYLLVFHDTVDLYIVYLIEPPYLLLETHLDVEDEFGDFPMTKNKNNPKIGHFEFSNSTHIMYPYSASVYKIPVDDLDENEDRCVLIAAHAVVAQMII